MPIVHLNIIGFYTAVAQAIRPRLKGAPLAVVAPGRAQRILLDVSRQAMVVGVERGMVLETARRLCPDLVMLDPTPDLYDRAMTALLDEAWRFSPQVEPSGPGHVFIDLAGTERLWGPSLDAAESLRRAVIDKYRLNPTLGVAQNKLVSKVATRVVRPEGLCEVLAGSEREFLSPLPIGHLPGVDEPILRELLELNLQIVADIHSLGIAALTTAFGSAGNRLFKISQGEDDSPVRLKDRPAPSVLEEFVFPGQTNDQDVFRAALWRVCSRSACRLRKMGQGSRRIVLNLSYADGQRVRRTRGLSEPTLSEFDLFAAAEDLLIAGYERRVRLRSLSVRLEELGCPSGQLYLFDMNGPRRKLLDAIDSIRERFGEDAIDLAAFGGTENRSGLTGGPSASACRTAPMEPEVRP